MTSQNIAASTELTAYADQPDAYIAAVEQALSHYHDADWLAIHSPLATPYFLGTLPHSSDRITPRPLYGHALQRLLHLAADAVPTDLSALISTTFLSTPETDQKIDVISRQLLVSRRTYYRRRGAAIHALGQAMLKLAQPTLRVEAPPYQRIIGRDKTLTSILNDLRADHTVAITGTGGVGKTTLGGAVAHAWGVDRVFWYTIRVNLTDTTHGLLYSLAYFLNNLGAKATWGQIVAANGHVALEQILPIVRFDLEDVKSRHTTPLICIDEIGLLDQALTTHAQLIQLIEALRPIVPILLIGQVLLLDADEHHVLNGLALEETALMLRQLNFPAQTEAELARLHVLTRGHPLVIRLVVAIQQSGESLDDFWTGQSATLPSVELLFDRLWKRLSDTTRAELKRMCVYRSGVPINLGSPETALITSGPSIDYLSLSPVVQAQVLRHMSGTERRQAHEEAAQAMLERGDYFEAAHHFCEVGDVPLAVWTWYAHRKLEVERGRGSAALAWLTQIDPNDLANEHDRQVLHIARSELLKLAGRHEEAAEAATGAAHAPNPVVRAHALRLEADAHAELGQSSQALDRYRVAIETLTANPNFELVAMLDNRSYVHSTHDTDLEAAMRDAKLAQVYANVRRGNVEQQQGHFEESLRAYESAHVIAESIPDALTEQARAAGALGGLYWQLNRLDEAKVKLSRALEIERVRDHISILVITLSNLSGVCSAAGEFDQAVALFEEGLQIATRSDNTDLIANFLSNGSEMYLSLGDLAQAEHLAQRALAQEAPYWRAPALTTLGQVQARRGQLDEAIATLRSAIDAARENRIPYDEATAWRALATALHTHQRPDDARAAAQSALDLYTAMGLAKEQAEMRVLLDKIVWVLM